MDYIQQLQHISSYTSKLLRHKFGRGPEHCIASIGHHFLVIYIRGFLSPMEDVLLRQGHAPTVARARDAIMSSIREELKGVIQVTLEKEVHGFYDDWIFPNNNGVIIAVLKETTGAPAPSVLSSPVDIRTLETEVARLSALVQKVPEQIATYRIHDKMYIVERMGILIPIEKALIAKGYTDELLITKDELEKTYFHRDGRFEQIFLQPVSDMFFDWSFTDDASIICVVLQ